MADSVVVEKRAVEEIGSSDASPKRPKAEEVGADRQAEEFRNYKDSVLQTRVSNFYRKNHHLQTFEVNKQIRASWESSPVKEMTIMEALELLNKLVDESDPDLDAAQTFHAYQTAEAARRVFPDEPWIHVCGLIHDAGKVVGMPEFGGFPQPFVVGDTFPLGVPFADKIVFHEYFEGNPDMNVPLFQTGHGVYQPRCGLRNMMMSYGHDEYLYRVLADAKTKLPEEALYIVRFHSFYAHHQHKAYAPYMDELDEKMYSVLRRFQPCDLYSKSTNFPHVDELKAYYAGLLTQFDLDKPLPFRVLTLPKAAQEAFASEGASSA